MSRTHQSKADRVEKTLDEVDNAHDQTKKAVRTAQEFADCFKIFVEADNTDGAEDMMDNWAAQLNRAKDDYETYRDIMDIMDSLEECGEDSKDYGELVSDYKRIKRTYLGLQSRYSEATQMVKLLKVKRDKDRAVELENLELTAAAESEAAVIPAVDDPIAAAVPMHVPHGFSALEC